MIRQISFKTKFSWISAYAKKDKIIKVKFAKSKNKFVNKNLKIFEKNLKNFFSGKNKIIKSKINMNGSIIQKKIWEELRKIKFGKTKSYGEIAKKYKLSPRYVGKICGQNKIPLIIPCHRVIKSNGNIGGFSARAGISLKKKLLDFEKNY
tara:strand:+ start:1244 stop:1693 length:450 start_codon:yes stop_codon:yes gene_type:complete